MSRLFGGNTTWTGMKRRGLVRLGVLRKAVASYGKGC